MVIYPYDLYILEKKEADYNPENGSFGGNDVNWVYAGKCRDEINGKGAKIITADGSLFEFSSVIYTPLGTKLPKSGDTVKVLNDCEVRIQKDVVNTKEDRLHKRIWL